jgi:hypothetical protein
MKARLQVSVACALGIFLVTASPAFAVEPVVVVDTDKPELGPTASTEFLAWVVLTPRREPSTRTCEPRRSEAPRRSG